MKISPRRRRAIDPGSSAGWSSERRHDAKDERDPPRRPGGHRGGRGSRRPSTRYQAADDGPLAGRALHRQVPADRVEPVRHPVQAGAVAGDGRVEPRAVVSHRETEVALLLGERTSAEEAPAYFATLFSASREQK